MAWARLREREEKVGCTEERQLKSKVGKGRKEERRMKECAGKGGEEDEQWRKDSGEGERRRQKRGEED